MLPMPVATLSRRGGCVVVCAILMGLAVVANSLAAATNSLTLDDKPCRFLTLNDAGQILGTATVRTSVQHAPVPVCSYAPRHSVRSEGQAPPQLSVQAWKGRAPREYLAMKPSDSQRRVRVAGTTGWYITPPTPSDPHALASVGTLAIYRDGHFFHIIAAGTENDRMTAVNAARIVLRNI